MPLSRTFLDFERPIGELLAKVDELRTLSSGATVDLAKEVAQLEQRAQDLTAQIFQSLTPWQKTQLSRHPDRPYTGDYLTTVFESFMELHGDRHFGDDKAMIGGLARLGGFDVMVLGHEKGRGTKEKVYRNFGMPKPEGYRKALRLMRLAEKFRLPIITLIDTPGAFPGKGAEERGQAEAIAVNLREMIKLTVPVVSVVIGEGGSGGALAIGVANRVLMMQYAVYSVISPEGCASILWKDSGKAELAAEALRLTAQECKDLLVIDDIVPEPVGGAHRLPEQASSLLRTSLLHHLQDLDAKSPAQLANERYEKFMAMGMLG